MSKENLPFDDQSKQVIFPFICDPPQDFQHNGDDTSTRAMTRHAKCDI